jgi:hypothetical protein
MTDTMDKRLGGLVAAIVPPTVLLAGLLLHAAVAAPAAPACAPLCGAWVLAPAESEDPDKALEQAFARYKDPRPHRMHSANSSSIESMTRAADEDSLGPIVDRPPRDVLKEKISQTLQIPRTVNIGARENQILIGDDNLTPASFEPGEAHARVDAEGIARIRCEQRNGVLTISESYDSRRQYSRTFALQNHGNSLLVTRVITRPGLPRISLRSVYRRP